MKAIGLFNKEDEFTQCLICAHKCKIKDGKVGVCKTITNKDGVLYSLNYGILVAQSIDPIEKKPLFHFLPETFSYSIASPGCNFRCLGCQNADISQSYRDENYDNYLKYFEELKQTPPEEVVESALKADCRSISYTYTDPAVFFDYSLDVMELAHKKELKNVFVTNGYYTEESINAAKGLLDAANVDIKFFNDASYRRICGGKLGPVLEAVKMFYEQGVHLELTTLLIDEYNNNDEEIKKIADFIVSVSPDLPWHISRFFPLYKMRDGHITPEETIVNAYGIGKEAGLKYIYAGNVRLEGYEDTGCPSCGKLLIKRAGYNILENNVIKGIEGEGKCKFCGYKIYGTF
jgi:pyruvate formate lyase activating enzyme